jgi:hypothetical protein
VFTAVDSPRDEQDTGSFGDRLRSDVSITRSLADGERNRGVETQRLVHDSIEDGQSFDLGVAGKLG